MQPLTPAPTNEPTLDTAYNLAVAEVLCDDLLEGERTQNPLPLWLRRVELAAQFIEHFLDARRKLVHASQDDTEPPHAPSSPKASAFPRYKEAGNNTKETKMGGDVPRPRRKPLDVRAGTVTATLRANLDARFKVECEQQLRRLRDWCEREKLGPNLSTSDFARFCGRSRNQPAEWIGAGLLRAGRINGKFLIADEDAAAFLARCYLDAAAHQRN